MQPSSIIGNEIHIQREQLSYFYVKLDTSYWKSGEYALFRNIAIYLIAKFDWNRP